MALAHVKEDISSMPFSVGKLLKSLEALPKRSYLKLIFGILFFALILRILALLSLSDSIYYDYLLFDERVYHNWAVQLMNGTWDSKNVYEFAPLPAYFMALIYKLSAPDIFYIRLTNILFGVLTCLFICFIGGEIGGKKVGILSLITSAAYSPLIFYSIVPLKTALSLFLFSLFIWLFFKLLNNRSHWYEYFTTGIVAGFMINVRPNYLVAIPIALIFIFFFGYRDRVLLKRNILNTVLLSAGFTIAVLPFIIRNYVVAGQTALTVSQSGFNLYIGNNPNSDIPYYRPVSFASSSPFKQSIHFNIEANKRSGKKLSAQESSSFWIHEVARIAQENPSQFLQKLWQKTLVFFNRFEAGDHYHVGFISEFVPFFKMPMLSFWIILPLGMAGMIAGMCKDRKIAAGAAVFATYGLTLVAFFCSTRYRLPMLVILIPFAVFGCQILYKTIAARTYKRAALALFIVLFFTIIECIPVTGTDDKTAYYNTHALVLNAQGKRNEAVEFWDMSSKMNRSYSAFANLSLASFYKRKGNTEKAASYLDKIQHGSFAASSKYEMLGDISLIKRQPDKAETYYRKALDINTGKKTVWKKLIRLLRKKDKDAAKKELQKFKIISSYYER